MRYQLIEQSYGSPDYNTFNFNDDNMYKFLVSDNLFMDKKEFNEKIGEQNIRVGKNNGNQHVITFDILFLFLAIAILIMIAWYYYGIE